MINIQKNTDIKEFTTFGVPAFCLYFTEVFSLEEIRESLDFARSEKLRLLFVGGGSNILFVHPFEGMAVKLNLKGISEVHENEDYVQVTAKSGEEWQELVQYCIDRDYGGLENLSLIPGNAGTSPMQNIGAYGVEIKDTFHSLQALNTETGIVETFTKENCNFGYRESFFKNEGKDRYIILEVTYRLTKKNHRLSVSYGSIKEELHNNENPSLKDISEAVIRIRRSKLPDPKVTGNAGSFFKNPVISAGKFRQLEERFPEIPHYVHSDVQVKIPAGWLIEQAGWKGRRIGNAGVHEKQALVLVNYGGATGEEIYRISEAVIQDVNKIFNIQLQREVNIVI